MNPSHVHHHHRPSATLRLKFSGTKKVKEEEEEEGFENEEETDQEEDEFEEVEEEEEEEEEVEEIQLKKKRRDLDDGFGSKVSTMAAAGGGEGGGVGVAPPLVCRVEKCRTDLSESKKYHKRHRVCEYHAKAQVAMVDGLKQRFCQQCSRFHELPEFDETKRSCRRRLEGHNARRRKNSMESRGEGSSRLAAKKEQCRSQMVFPKNHQNLHIH